MLPVLNCKSFISRTIQKNIRFGVKMLIIGWILMYLYISFYRSIIPSYSMQLNILDTYSQQRPTRTYGADVCWCKCVCVWDHRRLVDWFLRWTAWPSRASVRFDPGRVRDGVCAAVTKQVERSRYDYFNSALWLWIRLRGRSSTSNIPGMYNHSSFTIYSQYSIRYLIIKPEI